MPELSSVYQFLLSKTPVNFFVEWEEWMREERLQTPPKNYKQPLYTKTTIFSRILGVATHKHHLPTNIPFGLQRGKKQQRWRRWGKKLVFFATHLLAAPTYKQPLVKFMSSTCKQQFANNWGGYLPAPCCWPDPNRWPWHLDSPHPQLALLQKVALRPPGFDLFDRKTQKKSRFTPLFGHSVNLGALK